jgi:hypothetical protein
MEYALNAQVRYRQDDMRADADRARLGRVVRPRRFRWLTSRDADRLRSDVAELIIGAAPNDSPQWSLPGGQPRRAEVR